MSMICKQPTHKAYADDSRYPAIRDRLVTCESTKFTVNPTAKVCSQCGRTDGRHTDVACGEAKQFDVNLVGTFCENGHKQPLV